MLLVACARVLAAVVPAMAGSYYSVCAVGFSGVLFALKVCHLRYDVICQPLRTFRPR